LFLDQVNVYFRLAVVDICSNLCCTCDENHKPCCFCHLLTSREEQQNCFVTYSRTVGLREGFIIAGLIRGKKTRKARYLERNFMALLLNIVAVKKQ